MLKCFTFSIQIDKDIAKAFSNKPTLKKAGAIIPPIPNQNSETIKGAQKGEHSFSSTENTLFVYTFVNFTFPFSYLLWKHFLWRNYLINTDSIH